MTVRRSTPLLMALLYLALLVNSALGASWEHKRSKSDRDVNAIGHRTLRTDRDWYPREMEIGDKIATTSEQSTELLRDPAITSYVDSVAQRIARNSDATFPITVHIVNRRQPMAYTMMGGHQFISWGLLAQLHGEGELASILARGIAHTALRSAAVQLSRLNLMELASLGGYSNGPASYAVGVPPVSFSDVAFKRINEGDADYFGIQYIYKAGYDTDCFVRTVEEIWRAPSSKIARETSPFPPTAERVKALHKEIALILPRQDRAITSTSEFDEFQKRLQTMKPPANRNDPGARPKLIRHPAT